MKLFKCLSVAVLVALLAACGGGGVDTAAGSTAVVPTSPDSQTNSTGSMTIDVVSGAGVSTNSISALEVAQAKVMLKDSKGVGVKGVIVTFVESTSSLLAIAPASKTALTDDAGQASIEIRAISTISIGATEIGASANVSTQAISTKKAIQIISAPTSDTSTVSPQDLAAAINFLEVNPADKSIVIQGSGGNGRSESATLRFRVVDKKNTPVKGTIVNFEANPASDVTLNISSATTDAEGIVITTVSSKSVATSLVVKASVSDKIIFSQSDQLLVTTGVGIQSGFEIGADKYNLDGGLSGDSTNVTVRIVDMNGNPVADGVPVVFTTSGGRIGSSARGGCTTLDGKCSVVFEVQDPRNDDLALVTASTRVGAKQTLSGSFQINMSNPNLSFSDLERSPVSVITMSACKQSFTGLVANQHGRGAAAGTTVAVKSLTDKFVVALKSGSPILDSRFLGFPASPVTLDFDASKLDAPFACIPNGFTLLRAKALVEMTTPASKLVSIQAFDVSYPGGSAYLADPITEQIKSELTLTSCSAENQKFRVLTNIPGQNLSAGMSIEASNNSGALTSVLSGSPVNAETYADVSVSIKAPSGGPEACNAGGTSIAQFPLNIVFRLNSGQLNQITQIQTVTVKYAKTTP